MDYGYQPGWIHMEYEEDLFQKIISREYPADVVFEDEYILAFHWFNPVAPVHILIIPKEKIETINDINEKNMTSAGRLVFIAREIATDMNLAEKGYRLVFNVNPMGGQHVYHIHLHLLAGRKFTWPPG